MELKISNAEIAANMKQLLKHLFVVVVVLYPLQVFTQTIVTSNHGTITAADLDAELLKLNPDERASARGDARSVSQLMEALHTYYGIAKIANAEGFDKDPVIKRSMELAAMKQMVSVYLNSKTYNEIAAMGDITPAAKEVYTLKKAKYLEPAAIESSHILIKTTGRTDAEALAKAAEVATKARAGESFATLAEKYSEDTASKAKAGKIDRATQRDVVEAYWNAASQLRKSGDISSPIKSEFGYHVIRLDAHISESTTPFESVKDQIISELKATRAEKYRTELISKIAGDASIKINDDAFEKYTGATRITPKK